ncbi:MAG: DUF1349 domain-containing protein [Blastocatellia bacterium]
MKTIHGIILLSITVSACGSAPAPNKPSANAPKVEQANSKADVNTANKITNATSAPKGEKVEREIVVKFAAGNMPQGWMFIDPDGKDIPSVTDTKNGVFKLTIPSGKDLYGENRTAPRLLKAIAGDFEIETRVKFDPKGSYQGAGLIIFKDDNNYLRLERCFGGVAGGDSGIRLDARKTDEYQPLTTPNEIPTDATEVDLRIVRKGKSLAAFWRQNEDSEWKEVGEFESDYPETVQAGLIGVNTTGLITAEFAYIKLTPAK